MANNLEISANPFDTSEKIETFAKKNNLSENVVLDVLDFINKNKQKHQMKKGDKIFFDFDETLTAQKSYKLIPGYPSYDAFKKLTVEKKDEVIKKLFPDNNLEKLKALLLVTKAYGIDIFINSRQSTHVIDDVLRYCKVDLSISNIYGKGLQQGNKYKTIQSHIENATGKVFMIDDNKEELINFPESDNIKCIVAKKPIFNGAMTDNTRDFTQKDREEVKATQMQRPITQKYLEYKALKLYNEKDLENQLEMRNKILHNITNGPNLTPGNIKQIQSNLKNISELQNLLSQLKEMEKFLENNRQIKTLFEKFEQAEKHQFSEDPENKVPNIIENNESKKAPESILRKQQQSPTKKVNFADEEGGSLTTIREIERRKEIDETNLSAQQQPNIPISQTSQALKPTKNLNNSNVNVREDKFDQMMRRLNLLHARGGFVGNRNLLNTTQHNN